MAEERQRGRKGEGGSGLVAIQEEFTEADLWGKDEWSEQVVVGEVIVR
jgi:hypothetical protein